MPTVLSLGQYRFSFYSREPNEPPHIQVESGDGASLPCLSSGFPVSGTLLALRAKAGVRSAGRASIDQKSMRIFPCSACLRAFMTRASGSQRNSS